MHLPLLPEVDGHAWDSAGCAHLVPRGGADARRAGVAGEELPGQAQHVNSREARRLQAHALPHRRGHSSKKHFLRACQRRLFHSTTNINAIPFPCRALGLMYRVQARRGLCTLAEVVDGDDDGMLRECLHQADDVLAGLQPGRELVPAPMCRYLTDACSCREGLSASSCLCRIKACWQPTSSIAQAKQRHQGQEAVQVKVQSNEAWQLVLR